MSWGTLLGAFSRHRARSDLLSGPIRGELLGAEGLTEHARAVARQQRLRPRRRLRRIGPLLRRLQGTLSILEEAHARIAAQSSALDIGPAGEWLLDNFYVVRDHIADVRQNLPRGYYGELPDLSDGPLAGYPRVYDLAIGLISHSEGRLDAENIGAFTSAFQEVSPLAIGELWALPAMFRLGLVENVRRMTLRTVQRLEQLTLADDWASRLHAADAAGPVELVAAFQGFIGDHPALTAELVSRLRAQLRQLGGSATAMTWLDRWLDDEGHGAEESTARATQRLALTQVMMANSITSLRTLGGMDWPEFVEAQSVLEAALRQDPAKIYSRMTFETRDHYRHVVERLARRTGRPEEQVARAAVELAQRPPKDGPASAHLGFFLLGAGRTRLEQSLGYRPPLGERLLRAARRHPDLALGVSAMLGTAAALAAVLWMAGAEARPAWPLLVLLALLPANEVALNVIQQLLTSFLRPQRLPKLDFRKSGVPAESRTAVVIPTLLASVESVEHALENLEVQFLANRGANLHFVVLGDFTDAPREVQEDDASILVAAVAGVKALNARYGPAGNAFYLLHRPRRFNPQQRVWMGWERKRGKLADFNHLVRGGAEGAFSVVLGDLAVLREVRYVITLDADTVLPPETAPLLVGAMAHPLNRPDFDAAYTRVVRGYGILQPRVGVSLPSANRTRFASIYSGHPGVDPYTTAVSDMYQDLYGEGSFTGKGIYDVDAFERATRGRFPPNTLLSHDLIEGCFARAGLATDIQVFDDYPSSYLTWTRRKHRWIRGDWQLLPWIRRTIPGPDGPAPNPLPAISLWKVIDNLRRSVVELAQLAFLIAGWTVLPGSPLRWTALWSLAVAAPWIVTLLLGALRPPLDRSWRAYYAAIGRDAVTSARQLGLALVFLPHQAWISADAILRTLWRMAVSRRYLLEWQTAFQSERAGSASARDVWRAMWPSTLLSAGLFLTLVLRHGADRAGPDRWAWVLVCGVLAGAWVCAPELAHWLGQSPRRRERRLAPALRADALRYALLHWRFFERFVTAETHWLAPDNVQEGPVPVVAMRTSPTNIGLQLLAITSARDLGFIPLEEMISQLERVFASLERLPRFRGHFYNWYDLHDLRELAPAYVSTVDSGNLAGLLIAVRQACLGIPDEPVFDRRAWRAAETALGMVGATAISRIEPKLRQARLALAAAERVSDVAAGLDRVLALDAVLARLEELEQAILAEAGRSAPLGAALEWTAWTRRLVAEQRRRVQWLETRAGVGRLGEVTRVFPTLRELSANTPGAAELVARLEALAATASRHASAMDFGFLYDRQRALFSIGYQLTSHTLDPSYYDLLASEARLASYVAIAKDDVPVDHWFHLGRDLSRAAGETALMSWSGTMFEYLMPLLLMRSFPETLLDQTYRGAVRRQIAYAAGHAVPWGTSESAYNVRDRFGTYQYRAFGVPDLALKRGLDSDLVIAPYASALAAMVEPARALANLRALERKGALGPYGFRDALDYTRPEPGKAYAVVENFMAHHLGMGLGALTNALTGQIWQRRFHADPLVRAAELLLYERIPRRLLLQEPQTARPEASLPNPELEAPAVRELDTPFTPQPRVALLGRLPYTVMLTNGGSGYSRYEGLAVTRWRADGTTDSAGQHCYVKDVTRGRLWSTAHQPVCARADTYHVSLATDRVVFHRTDGPIETRTEITTVPDDSAEVRRVTVTNNGTVPCEIELTSYGELVLAPPDADRAHPAFGSLFVETAWHSWCSAVTGTRRPRAPSEQRVWCTHVVATGEERVGPITCETDRSRFLGRGRSTRSPAALDHGRELGGTTGAVIDPIFALRCRLRLQPGRSASAAFTTLVTTTAERAFELADRYRDPRSAQRALDLAWTAAQIELRELGTSSVDAGVFQQLAGVLFFSDARLRAPEAELAANDGSQPMLWAIGLSGDWPILLATIDSTEGLPTLRQLLAAHQYWRRRGMLVDLVLLNTRASSYLDALGDQVTATVLSSSEAGMVDHPGGVFVRRRDLLGPAELRMLRATARVHLPCDGRRLGPILESLTDATEEVKELRPAPRWPLQRTLTGLVERWRVPSPVGRVGPVPEQAAPVQGVSASEAERTPTPLRLDNGLGGLDSEGGYRIRLRGSTLPPAPWANVVANPEGGFLVSERGAGFTWAGSSFFYRLTPWHNDPVTDPMSDALYLRDEDTGELWTPTPGPIRHPSPYLVRHDAGASTFEHRHSEVESVLTFGLAEGSATRISRLRLTNHGRSPRRIGVTAYVEWTLGSQREHTQHQIRTEFDAARGTIFARNTFDPQFAGWVAFCALGPEVQGHTADRREFLGRHGSAAAPAGIGHLGGRTGAALDPCAALQCTVSLGPGESREVVVLLGAAPSADLAREAVDGLRGPARAAAAIDRTVDGWDQRLSAVQVHTPEPAFDALLNRWLLYQALSCRMWGRSGLYQSSGAYGFRDQLQDSMAFLHAAPDIARAHLLRAAGRQFVEGDVQHWWHPESGRGVRTRFSDDLAWLPFAVDHYLTVTGDRAVLDEPVPFLAMRTLQPGEQEAYDLPQTSPEVASLYEHCLRALRKASTRGIHGLPLMGGGDWNDGMNRVGAEGRGESVWLAWFLAATLRAFAEQASARGDATVAAELRRYAEDYLVAVEEHGWDGAWYRRAYDDAGVPLGSSASEECRIDSIAQSWSVICGGGRPERRLQAMRSLEEHLVDREARLVRLLTPPFDRGPQDPGYIKGYLPGVRENGAQYTHAAVWAVLARAMAGDGEGALDLFQMLNPLTHTRTAAEVATYKVEPYVVAADVYTAEGQRGRGGWTWYTGSASWMYRVGLEAILGFTRRGDSLQLLPCVPAAWREYAIDYRFGGSPYSLRVERGGGAPGITLDGRSIEGSTLPLVDDGRAHTAVFRIR
ncbi:MAG TPA: glucoamylase family protein [Myxococcaceae bacterium]|nr:glucoamylase family protein [Myxococcaceae bacterium]